MRKIIVLISLALGACTELPTAPSQETTTTPAAVSSSASSARFSADNFIAVVDRVEPVAERICRAKAPGLACDYQIIVDKRANLPPNAYQTVDRSGRPIIGFTVALIAEAQNQDELAFILGHEAAHHIAGHLERQRQSAITGAVLAGILASIGGAEAGTIESAQRLGATVGARAYSKDFELEADGLGAVIAHRAGFDAVLGAQYFTRIADPGNRFLGTHPPNASRIEIVRQTVSQLH